MEAASVPRTVSKTVALYVCPTPTCGSYYGSARMNDLSTAVNRRSAMRNLSDEAPENWGRVTSTRAQCPDCRARGLEVERVLVRTVVVVPTEPEAQ